MKIVKHAFNLSDNVDQEMIDEYTSQSTYVTVRIRTQNFKHLCLHQWLEQHGTMDSWWGAAVI